LITIGEYASIGNLSRYCGKSVATSTTFAAAVSTDAFCRPDWPSQIPKRLKRGEAWRRRIALTVLMAEFYV
jgi:hypothetical protein